MYLGLWGSYIMGASCFLLIAKYYSGDQIKISGMGGERGIYGGEEGYVQGLGRETSGKKTTWKTQA
jgi:hypothetical protein